MHLLDLTAVMYLFQSTAREDENRKACHCKHAFSCPVQLKEFKHVLEKNGMAECQITSEGYHGIALVYRSKRIDLGSIHYKCKTNMSIPHKSFSASS